MLAVWHVIGCSRPAVSTSEYVEACQSACDSILLLQKEVESMEKVDLSTADFIQARLENVFQDLTAKMKLCINESNLAEVERLDQECKNKLKLYTKQIAHIVRLKRQSFTHGT